MEILAIFPKEVIRSLFICTLSLFLKYNNKRVLFSYFSTNSYIEYSRIRPVISCPFRVKKKRIHFLKKKKKKKKGYKTIIFREIFQNLSEKREKISQTYHYSLLFFIINPIYKKEIASNSRSNLFRVKKERQRERENFLSKVSPNHVQSRSIRY